MRRVSFFVREAVRALRRNTAPGVAATVTIVITVLLLGVYIPVLQTTRGKAEEVASKIELDVYLYDDATRREITTLERAIGEIAGVESVRFVSKAQALRSLRERLRDKDIVDELPGNPLPASFRIRLTEPERMDDVRAALAPPDAAGKPKPISPIIEEVKDSRQEAGKILSVTDALKVVLTAITALLLLASVLLVANTIRLSIYSRRREIEVMRLVGATNWFIRWPFVVEGMVVGFIGGLAAVGILWLGKATIVDPLSERFALVAAQNTLDFLPLVLLLLASATLVSALGSGVTLRRYLRV